MILNSFFPLFNLFLKIKNLTYVPIIKKCNLNIAFLAWNRLGNVNLNTHFFILVELFFIPFAIKYFPSLI